MSKLPTQLKWAKFKCVLKAYGYDQLPGGKGSARNFYKQQGDPDLVTFHEPHGNDTLRKGTLSEYLRKLKTDKDAFLHHLANC